MVKLCGPIYQKRKEKWSYMINDKSPIAFVLNWREHIDIVSLLMRIANQKGNRKSRRRQMLMIQLLNHCRNTNKKKKGPYLQA